MVGDRPPRREQHRVEPMTDGDLRRQIREALEAITRGNFEDTAKNLLNVLGYESDRTLPEQTGEVGYFVDSNTKSGQLFLKNARSAYVLFQVTDTEIGVAGQGILPSETDFNDGNSKSFLFVAVEMETKDTYPRGVYAELAREINKRFPIPVVVLFKTNSNLLTLAFVYRRQHKLNRDRDVLGSVHLVREINIKNTHRAHLDILADLSLEIRLIWIGNNGKPHNFDGLLLAWLDALDTEELNRKFYRELFIWFEKAVKECRFPNDRARAIPGEEHIIRLITRLLFVWFIKEMGLVSNRLFEETEVEALLKNYNRVNGDSYYRAILQNLFFATLNAEIGQRRFSGQNYDDHRNPTLYRYKEEIADTKRFLELFAQTPFINGGLFDSLDSFEGNSSGGWRIDCFSDNVIVPGKEEFGILSIPNELFFGSDGLIKIFESYKFTVEENTPVEQEVALDPELLGKVFENLLAAYNPETKRSARRASGSYYTPRPIVDYMVGESLTKILSERADPSDGYTEFLRERLQYLFDYDDAYNDASEIFESDERYSIIREIAQLRTIDPAVGSGAFPMGVLHRLTLALQRLDPDNSRWEKVQKELALRRTGDAFDIDDPDERSEELVEISEIFEHYRSDFGRKLFLVQNSIFGVDIQPIACQIAKLRFFISLIVEQDPIEDANSNYGIKPLPNLEPRFVIADTLQGLGRRVLTNGKSQDIIKELRMNRERYFLAKTRDEKRKCYTFDKQKRKELAKELQRVSGLPEGEADKIAEWDPYDQNTSADWFDIEYMFDIREGFDLVIGNPPYAQIKKKTYSATQFPYSEGKDKGKQNLYKLFVEQSYNICKLKGISAMIVQSSLMCDESAAYTRKLLLDETILEHVIEFPERAKSREAQVFSSVTQGTCIYQFIKKIPQESNYVRISTGNDAHSIEHLEYVPISLITIRNMYPDLFCIPLIKPGAVSILEKIASNNAIKPLKELVVNMSQGDLNLSTHSDRFSKVPSAVSLLRGRHVSRYIIRYDKITEFCDEDFRQAKANFNLDNSLLISQEVMNALAPRRLNFALIETPPRAFLCGHTLNKTILKDQTQSKVLLAILNSKLLDWIFRITSTNTHIPGYQLKQLPIPLVPNTQCGLLIDLATKILDAKDNDPTVDTSKWEKKIDQIVYQLYGLTEEEIAVVEGL